jgi:hypothetical protein
MSFTLVNQSLATSFWFQNMSFASYDDDDDDASASMISTSELNGSDSANSSRKRKSKRGFFFRAWSFHNSDTTFQLIVNANLCNSIEEEKTLLTEHLCTGQDIMIPDHPAQ